MKYAYLLALLFSYAGVIFLDYRSKRVLWRRSAWAIILITLATLIAFDLIAIRLHIFTAGHNLIGVFIGNPNLPLEEILLLLFFGYLTLIIWERD